MLEGHPHFACKGVAIHAVESLFLWYFNYLEEFGRTSQIRTGDLYHVKALATPQDTLGHAAPRVGGLDKSIF